MGVTALGRWGPRSWRAEPLRGYRQAGRLAALTLVVSVIGLVGGAGPALAAGSTVVVVASPNPSVYGEVVDICATVTGQVEAAPTGTVTFDVPSGPDLAVPLDAEGESCVTSATQVSGTVTATYSGDGTFDPDDGTDTMTVTPSSTTTSVTAVPDPSTSGESVQVCATVTVDAPGSGVPDGNVTFSGPGGLNGNVDLDPAGEACVTASSLESGTVTATYEGDPGRRLGSSDTTSVTVEQAGTTTSVTATPEPSVNGQSVEVCATVTVDAPGSGTPTGTVTFTGPGGLNQTVTVTPTGEACLTTTGLSTGTVTATYNGDSAMAGSAGTADVTVGPAATSTTVTALPNPSDAGDPVEICATVTTEAPGSGTPTGTVNFTGPAGLAQTITLDPTGQACATTTGLETGTVSATYGGDEVMTGSAGTVDVTVSTRGTTTTVTATPDPSVTGQPVTVCATVTATAVSSGTPAGTVTLTGAGGFNQIVALDPAGEACATTGVLQTGTVAAVYSGDSDHDTSTGTDGVTVDSASTTTTVTAVPDPSVTGQSVQVCADVTATAPGAGTPTGVVVFAGPNGLNDSVPMIDGHACAMTSSLGTGTVVATYTGSPGYDASTGSSSVTMNAAPTTTAVTATRTGSSVEACATVTTATPVMAGLAAVLMERTENIPGPTGTVTFTGLAGLNQTATVHGGEACVTVTDVVGGTVTATYNGNIDYESSTGTATVVGMPPGAPDNVTAVQGTSSIVVSWEAPSAGAEVTGYVVTPSPQPATCTMTGPTSCVLGGVAGTAYTVTVVAQSAAGDSPPSEPSNAVTPVAPVPPATPPAAPLTLTTTDGAITVAEPGQQIVFVGTGFAPFSTVVVTIYSAPIPLATVTTDGNGNFQAPITVPSQLSATQHTVVAQGVAPDGTARAMALALTVVAGAGDDNGSGNDAGDAALAVTGPSVTLMLLTGGALALTGGGLVTVTRNRPRRRIH